jgi:hypothetical protein
MHPRRQRPRDPHHWSRTSLSTAAGVSDYAPDEQRDPDKQPWQRVQVVIASACRCRLPAGRAWPGTLKPSDIEGKHTDTAEESERGTANRRPRGHQPTAHNDWCENEYTERHEAEGSSTSDKRPCPEPAAVGCMYTKRGLQSSHLYSGQIAKSIAGNSSSEPQGAERVR